MVDVETIGVLVTAASVSIAATYYIMNLRISQKNQELMLKSQDQTLETRQTQLFMQIYTRYLEDDLFGKNYFILMGRQWKNHDDYVKKYISEFIGGPGPDGGDLTRMMTFYEGVAVLIMRKMIDISLVYELMPTNVTALWTKYEPLIKYWRANGPTPPNVYKLVEYLSNSIAEYAKVHGDPVITKYSRNEQVND